MEKETANVYVRMTEAEYIEWFLKYAPDNKPHEKRVERAKELWKRALKK